jgi:hypothetical protein
VEKQLIELWNQALQDIPFGINQYLHENLVTDVQNARLNIVFKTLRGNVLPKTSPIAWGGKIDEEKLTVYLQQLQKLIITNPSFKTTEKYAIELDKLLQLYAEYCRKKILNTAAIAITVQYLPFEQIYLLFQPRILWPTQNPEKMLLVNEGYTLGAELLAEIPRSILIGKIKKEPVKIVPITKHIELPGYSPKDSPKPPTTEYISHHTMQTFQDADLHHRFVDYLTHPILTNFFIHKTSDTHGSPSSLAEHLNADLELLNALEAIKTPIDSDQTKEMQSVIAVLQKLKQATTVLLYDYQYLSFEGILKSVNVMCHIGAACYTFPGTRIIKKLKKSELASRVLKSSFSLAELTKGRDSGDSSGIDEFIPSKLEFWTQSELDEFAAKRGIINLPTWTEQELQDLALQRGIIKLPVWSEEELELQAKTPDPSLTTYQSWTPDPLLTPCPKCDYLLQPEWEQCPICGTMRTKPLTTPETTSSSQTPETSEEKPNENSKDNNDEVWHPPANDTDEKK